MFRQTFIRAAIKRNLKGGASNDAKNHQQVHCSLEGNELAVNEMINKLQEGKRINSWNAYVNELHYYHYCPVNI